MKLLINRHHSIDIQFLKDCQVSIDIGSPYRIVLKTRIVPPVVHDVYSLVCITAKIFCCWYYLSNLCTEQQREDNKTNSL